MSEYVPYNGIPVILSLLLSLYVYGPSPLHKGRHPPLSIVNQNPRLYFHIVIVQSRKEKRANEEKKN